MVEREGQGREERKRGEGREYMEEREETKGRQGGQWSLETQVR